MDRLGPTGKVSKKRVHLLRWTNFPGRTGWNFGWMDRALRDPEQLRLRQWILSCEYSTNFILERNSFLSEGYSGIMFNSLLDVLH